MLIDLPCMSQYFHRVQKVIGDSSYRICGQPVTPFENGRFLLINLKYFVRDLPVHKVSFAPGSLNVLFVFRSQESQKSKVSFVSNAVRQNGHISRWVINFSVRQILIRGDGSVAQL